MPIALLSQTRQNFNLLDSISHSATSEIRKNTRIMSLDSVRIAIEAHPAAWLIEKNLLTELPKQHFFQRNYDSTRKLPLFSIKLQDFAIRYFLYPPEKDSLIREAQLILTSTIEDKGEIFQLPIFSKTLLDTISRQDLPFLESRQYSFVNAPVPDIPSDFFSAIAEPLLLISAAIITVLLLFTVRSQ